MYRLAIVFALLFAPRLATAADFDPKPIDEVVEKAMAEFQVPGAAIAVVRNDEVIYLKGFGVREKGKKDKVTPHTVFPIASCTKAFTATALATEVDKGELAWDDKVRAHLDYFRLSDELADHEVTVRDLLCHRTGMPRHDMLWSGLSLDSTGLIKRWEKGASSTSFRSTWEYSNVPFTTAGVIAGQFGKDGWAGAIEERLFKPLEMTESSCTAAEGQAAEDHVTPHYLPFDKTKPVRTVKWDVVDSAGGAGAINSTASNMSHWLRMQLADGKYGKKRVVSAKTLQETRSPQMVVKLEGPWLLYFPPRSSRFVSYGLGWFVHDYRGFGCVSHGGTLTGIRAQIMLIPEMKLGVFVACNVRPSLFPEAVARSTVDHLLGLPSADWVTFCKDQFAYFDFNNAIQNKKRLGTQVPDTKPSLALKSYAGTYQESAYGKAQVVLEDDQLRVKWGKFVFKLEHFHYDTFTAVPVEPAAEVFTFDRSTFEVMFRLNEKGLVESMKLFEQDFKKAKG